MSAVSIVNVINEWASSRPKKLTFTRTGFCFLELQHVCLGVGVKITLQAWSLFVLAQNSFFKPWLVFPWQSTVIHLYVLSPDLRLPRAEWSFALDAHRYLWLDVWRKCSTWFSSCFSCRMLVVIILTSFENGYKLDICQHLLFASFTAF